MHFSLILLVFGSTEAFLAPFTYARARFNKTRLRTHKSQNMLPCFRNTAFNPANIGQNNRKQFKTMLPMLPKQIGGRA